MPGWGPTPHLRGWPALAVDDRGDAHAVWLDHRGLAARRAAGAAAKAGPHVHASAAGGDSSGMAQGSALYYSGSAAGSLQERQIAAGVCYCCKTALASGRGSLLVAAWRHV